MLDFSLLYLLILVTIVVIILYMYSLDHYDIG